MLLGCTPKYARYIPDKYSHVKLEFEYPSDWTLIVSSVGAGKIIGFWDPSKPTSTGFEPDPEQAFIMIDVESIDSNKFVLEDEIERWIKESPYNPITFRDQLVRLGQYNARWLTFKIEPNWIDYMEPMIFEEVFLVVDDLLYRLSLQILESERDGSFGLGFDHIVMSLKVIE